VLTPRRLLYLPNAF